MRLLATVLLFATLLPAAACDDDGDDALSPAVETIMAEGATRAAAAPTVDLESTPTPLPPTRVIVLDSAPRPRPAATPVELGGTPLEFSPPDWRVGAAAIYDTLTGGHLELGRGEIPMFVEGSKHALWIERRLSGGAGQAWVIGLPSGERTALGAAERVSIESPGVVQLWPAYQTPGPTYNLAGTPVQPAVSRTPGAGYTPVPRTNEIDAPPGYRLFQHQDGWESRFVVTGSDRSPLLEFRASRATAMGDDLLVMTAVAPTTPESDLRSQPVNVYIVDLPSGEATFLATTEYDASIRSFTQTDRYLIWSEGFCTDTPTATYVFNRMAETLRTLDVALRVYERGDGLFNGFMGEIEDFEAVILNLETMSLVARFDPWAPQMAWSDDWRYAASGMPQPKGGGPCGI